MGLLSNIRTRVADVTRNWMLKDASLKAVHEGWAGGSTASGIDVNESRALNYSAVWAAVNVISSSVASLPLIVYRTREDGGRERATTSNLYWLLHEEPNPEMTPFTFKETLMVHLLLKGNAYCEIQRDNSGKAVALWPIDPDEIKPVRKDGKLIYEWSRGGAQKRFLAQQQVLHFTGLGYDGLQGYSVIAKAREAIGLGLATEKFGSTFFGNGAWPGLTITFPEKVTPEVIERLKAGWEKLHGGPDKAHKLAVFEMGAKVEKVAINPEDSQFLQTREFQVEEIARWFHLPPHKLAHKYAERPGGSIEAQNIEFVTDTLRPWLIRIEQEINRKLVSSRERGSVFAEFLVDALLRGDTTTRYTAYATAKSNGWLSVNEIRRMENLNPIGPEGDQYGTPTPAPTPEAEEPEVDEDEDMEEEDDADVRAAHRDLVVDAMGRMVRAEANAVRKLATRSREEFVAGVREFYTKQREKVTTVMSPVLRACRYSAAPESFAATHCDDSMGQLLAIAEGDDLASRVEEIVSSWEGGVAVLADMLTTPRSAAATSQVREAAQPIINVNPVINVSVPEQKAPVVSVENRVEPTPVTVAAPVVNIQERERRVTTEHREVIRDPATSMVTGLIVRKEE